MSRRDPVKRINEGFAEVEAGIKDLRADFERAAIEQEARRAALGSAEGKSRSMALDAMNARRSRHLQPNEMIGRRRPECDGPRAASIGGSLSGPTPVDDQTLTSLRMIGLSPWPLAPRRL